MPFWYFDFHMSTGRLAFFFRVVHQSGNIVRFIFSRISWSLLIVCAESSYMGALDVCVLINRTDRDLSDLYPGKWPSATTSPF